MEGIIIIPAVKKAEQVLALRILYPSSVFTLFFVHCQH